MISPTRRERLENTVTLITGGAGGIGSATAELFAREGSHVLIADTNRKKGLALAKSLNAQGLRASFFNMDVTDEGDVKRNMRAIKGRFKKIDCLVNIAGGSLPEEKKQLGMSVDGFRKSLEFNLVSAFTVTKHAFPLLRKGSNPVILNTSSINATRAIGMPAYSSAKAGLESLTRSLASHLSGYGIRANAVAPGTVPTKRSLAVHAAKGASPVFKELKHRLLVPSFGTPRDIADAFLFLAKSKFTTGHVLTIDGGVSIGKHVV